MKVVGTWYLICVSFEDENYHQKVDVIEYNNVTTQFNNNTHANFYRRLQRIQLLSKKLGCVERFTDPCLHLHRS